MPPARFVRLAGGFDHFGRFLRDLLADFWHAASEERGRIRLRGRMGFAILDRGHQMGQAVRLQFVHGHVRSGQVGMDDRTAGVPRRSRRVTAGLLQGGKNLPEQLIIFLRQLHRPLLHLHCMLLEACTPFGRRPLEEHTVQNYRDKYPGARTAKRAL